MYVVDSVVGTIVVSGAVVDIDMLQCLCLPYFCFACIPSALLQACLIQGTLSIGPSTMPSFDTTKMKVVSIVSKYSTWTIMGSFLGLFALKWVFCWLDTYIGQGK